MIPNKKSVLQLEYKPRQGTVVDQSSFVEKKDSYRPDTEENQVVLTKKFSKTQLLINEPSDNKSCIEKESNMNTDKTY